MVSTVARNLSMAAGATGGHRLSPLYHSAQGVAHNTMFTGQ